MDEKKKKPIEQVLKELFSFTQARTASSWESDMIRWPIGASSNSGSSEQNFLNNAKVENEKARAPKVKPYPLDFINDTIVDNYTNLCKLKHIMLEALKYPDLGQDDIVILKKQIKTIKAMIDNLKDVFYNVEKITL